MRCYRRLAAAHFADVPAVGQLNRITCGIKEGIETWGTRYRDSGSHICRFWKHSAGRNHFQLGWRRRSPCVFKMLRDTLKPSPCIKNYHMAGDRVKSSVGNLGNHTGRKVLVKARSNRTGPEGRAASARWGLDVGWATRTHRGAYLRQCAAGH